MKITENMYEKLCEKYEDLSDENFKLKKQLLDLHCLMEENSNLKNKIKELDCHLDFASNRLGSFVDERKNKIFELTLKLLEKAQISSEESLDKITNIICHIKDTLEKKFLSQEDLEFKKPLIIEMECDRDEIE